MKKVEGLTLLEVLIALTILSIALTAIIKSSAENIKARTYLQTKILCNWAAQEVLAEIQTGLLKTPFTPEQIENSKKVLTKECNYVAFLKATPNKEINEIHVNVTDAANHQKIISLLGYQYVG